jgi:hypothetical protein
LPAAGTSWPAAVGVMMLSHDYMITPLQRKEHALLQERTPTSIGF